MAYDPRPLASGDTLVASRDAIRTNFTILQSIFDENHVDLDGGSGGGKHKFLQMPEQSSAPTTAANEGGLYTKEADSVTNLFYRQESSGTEIQLTAAQAPTVATSGSTFLPGGILMQWGRVSSPAGTSGQVTFPEAFSTAPYSITLGVDSAFATATVVINTLVPATSTTFNWKYPSAVQIGVIYWMAIGPA